MIETKKLNFLFTRIAVKFFINSSNRKNDSVTITFLREEIKLIVFFVVLAEIRFFFLNLEFSSFQLNNVTNSSDLIIYLLLSACKKKVLEKLKFFGLVKISPEKINKIWLLKFLELEDSLHLAKFIVLFRNLLNTNEYLTLSDSRFFSVLLENFILKFSDILVYELFFDKRIPILYLKMYFKDYILLDRNMFILNNSFYWRIYFQYYRSHLNTSWGQISRLLIFTKNGVESKQYNVRFLSKLITRDFLAKENFLFLWLTSFDLLIKAFVASMLDFKKQLLLKLKVNKLIRNT